MRSSSTLGIRGCVTPEMLTELDTPLPSDDRERYIKALQSAANIIGQLVDEYHETYTIRHPVACALDELAVGLDDLKHGIVEPALRAPKGVGTKLMKASERRHVRAVMSLYNCLRDNGMPAREASRKVADATGVTQAQIRSWGTPGRNPALRK